MVKSTEPSSVAPVWRVWLVPGGLLFAVFLVYVLGKSGNMGGLEGAFDRVGTLSGSLWGLPGLIGLFCVGAYLGVPQFMLIGAAILAFGPWPGMTYSWLATLCSGALTFWTGRLGGEALLRRYGGRRGRKFSAFLGRNAFKASTLVRLIPSGPFILVNMVFGASGARFSGFLAGLALGAVPKLGLVALAAQGLLAAEEGALWVAGGAVIGVAVLWGGMLWAVQRKKNDFTAVTRKSD